MMAIPFLESKGRDTPYSLAIKNIGSHMPPTPMAKFMFAHTHAHAHTYLHTYTHIQAHTHVHTYTYILTHKYTIHEGR